MFKRLIQDKWPLFPNQPAHKSGRYCHTTWRMFSDFAAPPLRQERAVPEKPFQQK